MLRIIIHTQDCNEATHVDGAKAIHDYATFDISAPELEQFLLDPGNNVSRHVVGVEVRPMLESK